MREIKFRGQTVYLNPITGKSDWVYGDLVHYPEHLGKHKIVNGEAAVEVLASTIGQFTGWHDKDGKEIYDGDILDLYIPKNVSGKPEHRKRKVIFDEDNGCFSIVNKSNLCIFDAVSSSIELIYTVIGNIYDSPELMED